MKTTSIIAVLLCAAFAGCGGDGGDGQNSGHNHALNSNNGNNHNTTVGTLGNPCDSGACHDGSTCFLNVCTAGGAPGEACFPDDTCLAGYACHSDGLCYDAGGEGEVCLPGDTCTGGLSCHGGFCYLAGNAYEPCFPDNTCNEGFACANESVQGPQECRPAIMARVVNCLSSGGQSIGLQLVVGMVEFPEIPSLYATPCQPIPTGGVGITMYVDGQWYEDAFSQIGTENPEIYLKPTATSIELHVAACNAQLQCF